MGKKYRSDTFAAIHETMEALREVGAINKQTMREFDASCLTPVLPMSPEHIRALREREHLSQPVFARYLMGISQYRLAKEIGVSTRRINEIVKGMRAVTADTDLRLARFFGLSDGYWLRAQVTHDTEVAREKMQDVLAKIQPLEHA